MLGMNLLETTKQSIGSGSLKALFIGCELVKKPMVLAEIQNRFGLSYPNLPNSYPFDRYLELLDWLRQEFYPGDTEAKGYEKLGRAINRGFFQGPVGQVLKVSIRMMGPQRSLPYFFRITGGALKFGWFEIVEEKPNFIRAILHNVPGSPDIMRGMSLESMDMVGVKNPSITYYKFDELDTEFVATWES